MVLCGHGATSFQVELVVGGGCAWSFKEAEAVEEPDRPGSGAEEHGLVTVERDRAGLYVLFSCHDSPVKPPAIMIG